MDNGLPTPNPGVPGEPRSFGRYHVIEQLGEGAMGRVYLSEDPILKRRVAVKVIPTDRGLAPAVLAEYLERFAAEAQACARLNHPSIVSIYDAGKQDGVPWIAFEYVSGEHLDRLIARQKQLPFDRIVRIAGDIAAAMRHAHGMKIVHRDIKPANILIDDGTQIAKLSDFGIVKAPFTTITQNGADTALGSPGYMSPEQIEGQPVDARSDIFSFGIVLYEMITGTHPFLRDTVQATFFATVGCNYRPVRELRDDVPPGLARIVEKALVADRNLRIINADELCAMVAGCLSDADVANLMRMRDPKRDAATRAKAAYAVSARRARSIWKKVPPLFGSTGEAVAGFFGEKVLPPLRSAKQKVSESLEKRFTKSQITIVFTAAIATIAAVVLIALIAAVSSKAGDRNSIVRAAQEKGYAVKNGKQLIDTCRAHIERCDYWNANELADILITSRDRGHALQGRLIKAMAAVCADRFNDAAALFAAVRKLDGGEAAIRKEHPFFIKYLEAWMERELPDALIELSANSLYLHGNPRIKAWTKDMHYWVRWNAVCIMQRGGEKVDLVPVYILDLDHSASAKTKVRAAEKLGDLGDRRAVPALIAARDGKGPAASAARRILREKFDVW